MAKKAKDARSYVKIVSSESDHCYYVQKNRNNTKGRLELRKYDPTCESPGRGVMAWYGVINRFCSYNVCDKWGMNRVNRLTMM